MPELAPAAPTHVTDLFPEERAELLQLLEDLSPREWELPTECPAWTVKGIALHLLGDELSLLSRQRDDQSSPVKPSAEGDGWDTLFGELDRFNETWVETASFFSTSLLIDLLRITGDWTHRWYASVDPDELGETIHWISPTDPQPYWLLTAREYLERWIHNLQIRRAVNRAGLTEPRYVLPAVAVTLRGFPPGLATLAAPNGATVTITISDQQSWTLQRASAGWVLLDGSPTTPTARLSISLEDTATLFSRGFPQEEVASRVEVDGDTGLASTLLAGLTAFFGRSDAAAPA